MYLEWCLKPYYVSLMHVNNFYDLRQQQDVEGGASGSISVYHISRNIPLCLFIWTSLTKQI
jgi:hypothetical protein